MCSIRGARNLPPVSLPNHNPNGCPWNCRAGKAGGRGKGNAGKNDQGRESTELLERPVCAAQIEFHRYVDPVPSDPAYASPHVLFYGVISVGVAEVCEGAIPAMKRVADAFSCSMQPDKISQMLFNLMKLCTIMGAGRPE